MWTGVAETGDVARLARGALYYYIGSKGQQLRARGQAAAGLRSALVLAVGPDGFLDERLCEAAVEEAR